MPIYVTGHDVARLAGVSQATVSRALRNIPGTAPETRDAVLAAAAQLNYIPIDRGRVLATQSTRRIAIVAEELTNPYYPELIDPLRAELRSHGLRAALVSDHDTSDDTRLLENLADGSYDGVILTTTHRRSLLPTRLTDQHLPHVLVNRVLDSAESPSYTFDNADGVRQVVALLTDLGHVSIGAVHGPVDTSTGHDRAVALIRELRQRGLSIPRAHFRRADAFSHAEGHRLGRHLLSALPRPTAIVCGNDALALGVLSAAHELQVRVPEELTLIGFDDVGMADWLFIGLTTVRCDLAFLAKLAVSSLTDLFDGIVPPPQITRLPVHLQLRASHCPPVARHHSEQ
jgi:DNA-binding LacI/PurR family transcriptional regulator